MNYGVRWDRIRPWQEKFNQLQALVKGGQSQVFPGAPQGLVFPGDHGVPDSLAPARNNFAPRIGVAWTPSFAAPWLHRLAGPVGQTSIRLGYGVFYTAYEGLSAGIMSANPPYGYTYTSAAPPLFESALHQSPRQARCRTAVPAAESGLGAEPRTSECGEWTGASLSRSSEFLRSIRMTYAVRRTLDGKRGAAVWTCIAGHSELCGRVVASPAGA